MKSLLLKFNSYADAKGWGDLVHAFMESLKDTPFDELILLLHTNIPSVLRQSSKYIRTVSYDTLDAVPELLGMAPSPFRINPTLTHQTEPHAEMEAGVQHGEPERKIGVEVGERQVNAAKTIQAAYRRYLKQKDVDRKEVDKTQARYWNPLRERSSEMKWSKDSQYYILFRVPLADILICLDMLRVFFDSQKKNANKLMKDAWGEEHERLDKAHGEYRYGMVDWMLP